MSVIRKLREITASKARSADSCYPKTSYAIGLKGVFGSCLLASSLNACSSANFASPTGASNAGKKSESTATIPKAGKGEADGKEKSPINDSDGSNGAPADQEPQPLALSCTELADPNTAKVELLPGKPGDPVLAQLTGHICPSPQKPSRITVLFLIDWSGSMATMDPLVGASCGRLQAAKAITNYVKNSADPKTTVQEGMIPFSSAVDLGGILPLSDIDTFASNLTADRICRAAGGTNYIAPLQQARQMLTGVQGRVVIYFITDGAPNIGLDGRYSFDNDPAVVDQTITASRDLKAVSPGVTVNSILLGAQAYIAQSTMNTVSGDPQRVKLVANATDLAQSILKFESPTLVPTSATAELKSGGKTLQVGIASVTPDPDKPGDWIFTTEPFKVDSKDATIDVTVKDSDGGLSRSSAKIDVKDH